jgi:MoxR-like ATPase
MENYPFQLFHQGQVQVKDKSVLARRPLAGIFDNFAHNAQYFVPDPALETALNSAIALGAPLLLTGEAGSGKTQVAYYVARQLGLEPVIHFQAKSDSQGKDLLYDFDAARYLHDAQSGKENLNKSAYIEPRALWQAMAAKEPRVLLIDGIDQANRDFPNDLLHELDKMEFVIAELGKTYTAPKHKRPLVFVTSNSERRLPEAFLRRCVYHHLRLDNDLLNRVVDARLAEFAPLSPGFVKIALERFVALRDRELRKRPATGELLAWLRVLALAHGSYPERLDTDVRKLPFLGVLLKDHQDIEELAEK